jgi:hypothetical protein
VLEGAEPPRRRQALGRPAGGQAAAERRHERQRQGRGHRARDLAGRIEAPAETDQGMGGDGNHRPAAVREGAGTKQRGELGTQEGKELRPAPELGAEQKGARHRVVGHRGTDPVEVPGAAVQEAAGAGDPTRSEEVRRPGRLAAARARAHQRAQPSPAGEAGAPRLPEVERGPADQAVGGPGEIEQPAHQGSAKAGTRTRGLFWGGGGRGSAHPVGRGVHGSGGQAQLLVADLLPEVHLDRCSRGRRWAAIAHSVSVSPQPRHR